MRISQFFASTLKAPVRNIQWSWGGVDQQNQVFLRVWEDEIVDDEEGKRVLVLRDLPRRKSAGYPERIKHLEALKNGAECYGVVCKAVDFRTTEKRTIALFDDETLLKLGPLTKVPGATYAAVLGRVKTRSLTS